MDLFENAIPIPASRIVEKSAIEARKLATVKELTRRQELLLAYLGDSVAHITEHYFNEATFKEVPPASQNLLDRAIRKMSLVYKNQPEHDYGSAKLPDNYNEVKRWVAMRNAERKVNLLGTSLLHPRVVGVDQEKRLDWELIWFYFPIYSDDDLTKPSAVFYPINVPFMDVSRDNKTPWVYWSKDENFLFDSTGKPIHGAKGEVDLNYPWVFFSFVLVPTWEAEESC